MCKKEDLARFKADLVAHTESIEVLLMTVQIGATRIESRGSAESHKTLAGRLHGVHGEAVSHSWECHSRDRARPQTARDDRGDHQNQCSDLPDRSGPSEYHHKDSKAVRKAAAGLFDRCPGQTSTIPSGVHPFR